MAAAPPQVVVIGAGFGGLAAARALRRSPVELVVIDRENHHLFQPLVYQVAMAALSATDISAPIRSVLARQRNTRVVLGEVTGIDLERRQVCTHVYTQEDTGIPYDYLILACGTEPNYFGHDDWEPLAPSPKSLNAALDIRKRVLLAFEEAEYEDDPAHRRRLLEFVVVGGGPTGVEFAGALVELSRSTLARDFRRIDPRQTSVHLVESRPRLLTAYPPELSDRAAQQLEQLGVHLHLGATVVAIDPDGVSLRSGVRIEAATVIWGAGVRPTLLARNLPVEHDRAGRIVTGPDLSLPDHPEVFVVGDVARFDQGGHPLPGLAPVAMQEGRAAARSIERAVRGREQRAFRYIDKGTLATIGRSRGVGMIGGVRLSGTIAWLTWALVHIFYLVGFRNRLVVLVEWIWNYATFKRGARVIEGLHRALGVGPKEPPCAPRSDGVAARAPTAASTFGEAARPRP